VRALLLVLCLSCAAAARAADVFPSFAALGSSHTSGKDYRIEVADRRSTVTVFAIHGGAIEPGTEAVAAALAGTDWNLYRFESLLSSAPWRLHLTAAHYDEPGALALAARSRLGVAIHGQRDPGQSVCVGGGNESLRQAVADALSAAGFETEQPCRRLPGRSPANLVNRPKDGGVQLELSADLLRELPAQEDRLGRFCAALRAGVNAAGRNPSR